MALTYYIRTRQCYSSGWFHSEQNAIDWCAIWGDPGNWLYQLLYHDAIRESFLSRGFEAPPVEAGPWVETGNLHLPPAETATMVPGSQVLQLSAYLPWDGDPWEWTCVMVGAFDQYYTTGERSKGGILPCIFAFILIFLFLGSGGVPTPFPLANRLGRKEEKKNES